MSMFHGKHGLYKLIMQLKSMLVIFIIGWCLLRRLRHSTYYEENNTILMPGSECTHMLYLKMMVYKIM
jgi:hypothetical protein